MLIYESEGFIEVGAKEIKKLSRSVAAVAVGEADGARFDVQATLCEYLAESQVFCKVAFHAKSLKKALIFSVKPPENSSAWTHGAEIIAELGFKLEAVNLQLSSAMLEVVLKDVPGVASVAEARRQRTEKVNLLQKLQEDAEKDPESKEGKRAALKLGSERRLQERTEQLQQIFNEMFAPKEVNADFDSAMEQVKDLSVRLERAEAELDEERKQREMSEVITAAAEKRIQELEELLVDVETQSASELKQKRMVTKLKGQVKDLEEQLHAANAAVEEERQNQTEFVNDVKGANEQIVTLESKLLDVENELALSLDRLAEVDSEREQSQEVADKASERVQELEIKLKQARDDFDNSLERLTASEQTTAQLTESLELSETRIEKLEKSQKELQELLDEKQAVAENLVVAEAKVEQLQAELAQSSKALGQESVAASQLLELRTQCDLLLKERDQLRVETNRETLLRKQLEKDVDDYRVRIGELEERLDADQARSAAAADERISGDAHLIDAQKLELAGLKRKLSVEQAGREDLEAELEQAHKMIDSLEKMVRESSAGQPGDAAEESAKDKQIVKLEAKLELLAEQLEKERARQFQVNEAAAESGKGRSSDEKPAQRGLDKKVTTSLDPNVDEVAPPQQTAKASKPLPHETRPAPAKGELFHPDWDLEGLPCKTADQVFKAWETVFNVQISLDGYPSQYCMAYLVVLRVNKVKKVYMVFHLKQNKHTLVKVPAKMPKNEKELKNTIDGALQFLKLSGFEMEQMSKEYIESTLQKYFLES